MGISSLSKKSRDTHKKLLKHVKDKKNHNVPVPEGRWLDFFDENDIAIERLENVTDDDTEGSSSEDEDMDQSQHEAAQDEDEDMDQSQHEAAQDEFLRDEPWGETDLGEGEHAEEEGSDGDDLGADDNEEGGSDGDSSGGDDNEEEGSDGDSSGGDDNEEEGSDGDSSGGDDEDESDVPADEPEIEKDAHHKELSQLESMELESMEYCEAIRVDQELQKLQESMAECALTAGNGKRRRDGDDKPDGVAMKRLRVDKGDTLDGNTGSDAMDDGHASTTPRQWLHAGDCVRLLPLSIRHIREFFTARTGMTRAACHQFARVLAGGHDVTVVPAEAQFAGVYTVEVAVRGDSPTVMTLFQFRSPDAGDPEPPADLPAAFGRFAPEYHFLDELEPSGPVKGETLRVWRLRCPRGRPYVYERHTLADNEDASLCEGIMKDLAELIVTPLAPGEACPSDIHRESIWSKFKYDITPLLPQHTELDDGEKLRLRTPARTDYALDVGTELTAMTVKSSMEDLRAIFDHSWPWTPHNDRLSDMSILLTPDLSRIACVLEWRLTPMPFGTNLCAMESLLGTNRGGNWQDYTLDVPELSRCLMHHVRRFLRDLGTEVDAPSTRKLMVAMRFGLAWNYGLTAGDHGLMAGDHRERFLGAMAEFEPLQWDEEHF